MFVSPSFFITGLFRFVEVTRRLLVSEGEVARLECGVQSFPRGPDTIKWLREGYDLGECKW